MRLCALVVLLSACSTDPTLAVTVVHPVGLSVASTTVTVYESATLHCEDLEFARLDAAGLVALATSEADLDALGSIGSLSGISRTGNKVIVARGFDTNSVLVSAGCIEKGEVTGDDSVTVTTVIAAIVSIKPPGDNVTTDTVVTLTDASGAALPDPRPVTWTVYGPAGSTAANPSNVTSISDGTWEPALPSCAGTMPLKLHPNPPSTLGGYEVQIRVAWAVEEPPAYSSLAATAFTLTDLGGITLSTTARRACAIHVSGTVHTLVCVDNADLAHEYTITVTNGRAIATPKGAAVSAVPTVAQHSIALVAIAGSGTDRDVYSVTDKGVLVALFNAPPPVNQTMQCPLVSCADAMYVTACGGIGAKLLLTSNVGKTVHQLDPHGGNATTFDLPAGSEMRLDNAGCVTSLQSSGAPALGQLATIHGGTSAIQLAASGTYLVNCSSGTCATVDNVTLTRGVGVGFTGGSEPRIVVTTIDASGVVLVSDVFSPNITPIERARMPAASLPDHVVAGQVDTDTDPDVFWDIIARNGTNFEIAYARQVDNANLEALSPSQAVDVSDLVMGDLNGDGLDDLVVVTTTGIAIVPMGAMIPAPSPNTDATCMP
ncbi:MAG: VCBS repeat-containing protein [Kofleriaceae bacterium]